MRSVLRRLGAVSGLLLALGTLTALRTLQRGKQELAVSERAFAAGQVELALRHAERAAILYLPGAPHVNAAYARLESLAHGAEQEGDRVLAARAWQAVRSAALQSRHAWQPRTEDLAAADSNLERLGALAQEPDLGAASIDRHAPGSGWGLAIGFALAIGSLGWLSTAALTPRGAWLWQRARWPLFGFCVGVLGFSWALLRA